MSNPICRLLEGTPSGTAIRELMMNGEDVSSVEEFVRYDKKTGLAFFTNRANSVFVGICERIDMIEFAPDGEATAEQAAKERKPRRPLRKPHTMW